jgi:hypothetical protein
MVCDNKKSSKATINLLLIELQKKLHYFNIQHKRLQYNSHVFTTYKYHINIIKNMRK